MNWSDKFSLIYMSVKFFDNSTILIISMCIRNLCKPDTYAPISATDWLLIF